MTTIALADMNKELLATPGPPIMRSALPAPPSNQFGPGASAFSSKQLQRPAYYPETYPSCSGPQNTSYSYGLESYHRHSEPPRMLGETFTQRPANTEYGSSGYGPVPTESSYPPADKTDQRKSKVISRR
jgi:hypothetical protein